MISISKITQDSNGVVLINEDIKSRLLKTQSRVSRSATLDGGSVIDHQGYSNADLRFEIVADLTEDQEALLWSIYKSETYVNISTKEGVFKGVISAMYPNEGKVTLTILVEEKISSDTSSQSSASQSSESSESSQSSESSESSESSVSIP